MNGFWREIKLAFYWGNICQFCRRSTVQLKACALLETAWKLKRFQRFLKLRLITFCKVKGNIDLVFGSCDLESRNRAYTSWKTFREENKYRYEENCQTQNHFW